MENRKIKIPKHLISEAWDYAVLSKKFTSNRHDFHEGGLDNKAQKMFEGKLGEKIFKILLEENCIPYKEDSSSYKEADTFDFLLPDNCTVDVKTRTKHYHTRTLEMVEQINRSPKTLYISIRLFVEKREGVVVGWCVREDFLKKNRIENQNYLDNFVLYDNELRPIERLFEIFKEKGYGSKLVQ
ncbi:hypothetical protein GCM10009128_26320 [Psychrosphaera haliotis]|uniref:hypothetical protein n=1 Tax=Psychrosphaera haliotis TaxID=555083 RepID=UPI0031DCE5F2